MTVHDMAQMSTATTGTGQIQLGSASLGFQTFASAGLVNNETFSYGIQDLSNNWEVGQGTYITNTTGQFVNRSPTYSSSAGSAINLSGSAIIYVTFLDLDYNTLIPSNSISIGNSTVNVQANSSAISIINSTSNLQMTAISFFTGNSTANTFGNSTIKIIANSTSQTVFTPVSAAIGNSTANTFGNSIIYIVANSTSQTVFTPLTFSFGNSTANTSGNSIFTAVTNSTANSQVTPGLFSAANSTANTQVGKGTVTLQGAGSNSGLTLGTSSIAGNGYTWLPNGLLMQWMTCTTVNSTAQAFSLPVAFPTSKLAWTFGENTVAAWSQTYKVLSTASNTSSFTLVTANVTAITAFVIALGH